MSGKGWRGGEDEGRGGRREEVKDEGERRRGREGKMSEEEGWRRRIRGCMGGR